MAYVIEAIPEKVKEVQPKNGSDFSCEEINQIVGGHFERVALRDGKEMWLNEDGKRLLLPVNRFATLIFKSSFPVSDDVIVGNVLVCDRGEVR